MITIELYGLLLRLAIALAAALFLLIAFVAGVWSVILSSRPARRIAIRAALLCAACAVIMVMEVLLTETPAGLRMEWLDWLALPWLALVAMGCWVVLGPPLRRAE